MYFVLVYLALRLLIVLFEKERNPAVAPAPAPGAQLQPLIYGEGAAKRALVQHCEGGGMRRRAIHDETGRWG